jgi:hypothetical protein
MSQKLKVTGCGARLTFCVHLRLGELNIEGLKQRDLIAWPQGAWKQEAGSPFTCGTIPSVGGDMSELNRNRAVKTPFHVQQGI